MEVLAAAEFTGGTDVWTEHLCIERNEDGSITLSSRSRVWLGERSAYELEDGNEHIPEEIDGQAVWGRDGEAVVGERLELQDDEAEVTLSPGEIERARDWLRVRGWLNRLGQEDLGRVLAAVGSPAPG